MMTSSTEHSTVQGAAELKYAEFRQARHTPLRSPPCWPLPIRSHAVKRALASLLLSFGATFSSAADYPANAIPIVAAFLQRGRLDRVARILGADLSKVFGQQIVVGYTSVALGMIGTELALNSPPESYT